MSKITDILAITEAFSGSVMERINEAVAVVSTVEANKLLRYGISQKGQLIRPSLIYLIAHGLKPAISVAEKSKLIYFAASIELLHTASLMHDDILDCAVDRRGMKSIYGAFGSGCALLTGNIFYLNAFDIANKYLERKQMEGIIHAATDMCCGEIIQIAWQDKPIPVEVYYDIIRKKTASLIKHACSQSACIIGMPEETITAVQQLGEYLGIIYQLTDDFKDRDVLLEAGFNYKLQISELISKAQTLIDIFEESIFKSALQEFLEYFKLPMRQES